MLGGQPGRACPPGTRASRAGSQRLRSQRAALAQGTADLLQPRRLNARPCPHSISGPCAGVGAHRRGAGPGGWRGRRAEGGCPVRSPGRSCAAPAARLHALGGGGLGARPVRLRRSRPRSDPTQALLRRPAQQRCGLGRMLMSRARGAGTHDTDAALGVSYQEGRNVCGRPGLRRAVPVRFGQPRVLWQRPGCTHATADAVQCRRRRRTCPGNIWATHDTLPCRCWLEVAVDERLGDAPDSEGLSLEPPHAGAAAPAGPPAGGKGGAAAGEGAAAAEPWPPAKCAPADRQCSAWRAADPAQRASGGHRTCATGRLGA